VTTYTLYVHDSRYAVPTLLTVDLRDDDAVRAYAQQYFQRSPHYRSIEVWDDERQVGELKPD